MEDGLFLPADAPDGSARIDDTDTKRLIARAREIHRHVAARDPSLAPSALWKALSKAHRALLRQLGIARFKRGLSQSYSTFAIRRPNHINYRAVLRAFLRRPSVAPFSVRMRRGHLVNAFGQARLPDRFGQFVYASYIGLLWAMIDDGSDDLPQRLSEPAVGDPLPVSVRGKPVSQDLANSIHEMRVIRPHVPPGGVVAEVGAGYGRLGQVVHEAGRRYWIFDIAPALTVSEWYLAQVFPGARHFRWRPFESWAEIRDEALAADFAFFSADQLALLPAETVDAFAAISCLHEMTEAQCDFLLGQMGDKARAAIYTRNWTEMRNAYDDVLFRSADLHPPPGWQTARARRDLLWPRFTEKLFVRDRAPQPE